MARIKILTVALAAVFALSAIAGSSAFALEKAGEFVNKEGTTVKGNITLASSGSQVLETKAGVKVTCTSASATGTASDDLHASSTGVTFKGCKKSTGGTCHTAGKAAEEIVIGTLETEVVLDPTKQHDELLTTSPNEITFECAEVKVAIKAGGKFLTSSVSPEETLATEFTLTAKCTSGKPGEQEQKKYRDMKTKEEKAVTTPIETKIGTGAFEESCQAGSSIAKTAEQAKFI